MIEDGDAMEADVVEADQQLLRAADALIKKGDKTSLQKLVDSTADYKKENYLSAGWNTFEAALDAAKKVLADESATQEDVDKAKEVLTSAMTALRYKSRQVRTGRDHWKSKSNGSDRIQRRKCCTVQCGSC